MEDFFGCTIIVPTLGNIEQAEQLIREQYDLRERRPGQDDRTQKTSSDFRFDDLRLYVARKPSASGKLPELDGALFEVQIKTILQHAWSIATHDLIYKTDTVSWPKERIAFQVKAMLEHAEIAIAEAESLATSRGVSKKDTHTDDILKVIEQIDRIWSDDAMPGNRKRLAESIRDLLRAGEVDVAQLGNIIEAEKNRVGVVPRDLSPYSFVLQALLNSTAANFQNKFQRRHVRTSIVLQDGMDVPAWVGTAVRVVDLRSKAAPP